MQLIKVSAAASEQALHMHFDCKDFRVIDRKPGPGCSKLTTSLVNVSLKFQTLISQICQYFLSKKFEKQFFNKNITVFGYKVIKHLTS